MGTYLIVGSAQVAGKNPGDTVTDEDLAEANIPALIDAGHIKASQKADKKEQSDG